MPNERLPKAEAAILLCEQLPQDEPSGEWTLLGAKVDEGKVIVMFMTSEIGQGYKCFYYNTYDFEGVY